MSVIEGWGCEILVYWMDLEPFERINRCYCVLPHVSDDIVKSFGFKHVDRVRREPILQVQISDFLVLPRVEILINEVSQSIILIFSGKSDFFT